MKKKQHLEQKLCAGFCSYYKPGKNEELACKGYAVVERLLQKSAAIISETPDRKIDSATAEIVVQKMCLTCDFHEHDCDYMVDRAAPPCGGFILLVQLLVQRKITIEDF